MIHSFPLDYMHLVLLGVFKRLLQIWTGSWNKKWRTHKLGNHHLEAINRRMRLIRFSYPKEFHRIPTSLKNVGGLKAVELRSILLYSGPVLFKGILSKEKYEHFLYLHIGIRLLSSETEVLLYIFLKITYKCYILILFIDFR